MIVLTAGRAALARLMTLDAGGEDHRQRPDVAAQIERRRRSQRPSAEPEPADG